MANNLRQPVEISPGVRDTNADGTPDSNVPTVTFGEVLGTNWVSEWFDVQGVEHGAEEILVMVYVDWLTADTIDLFQQFRHRDPAVPQDPKGLVREAEALPIPIFDGVRLTAMEVYEQDITQLARANFRTDPGSQVFSLPVKGVGQIRFLARANAMLPEFRMQILAGGGWRGS